jgi:hypothetical protein
MSDKEQREALRKRIRDLMAKTVSNGCTEAEATMAARKADELMLKYEITLDEISIKEQEIVSLRVPGARHPVMLAASSIASFTDCRIWLNGSDLVYFGFEVDTEICEYLTHLFSRAIDRETAQFTMMNFAYEMATAQVKNDMKESFQVGMSSRLGTRLGELKSKRDFTVKATTGRDLVLVKAPMVTEAFEALGLKLGGRSGKSFQVRDPASYAKGNVAANGVALNQGITASRAQVGGRIR